MILSTLFYLLYGILYVVVSPLRLLDDATIPPDISASISQAGVYIGNINAVFPVLTVLLIVSAVLTIEGLIILYKSIKWAYQKIPFIN